MEDITILPHNNENDFRTQCLCNDFDKSFLNDDSLDKLDFLIFDIENNSKISDSKTTMGVLDFISDDIKKKENKTYVLSDIYDLDSKNSVTRYLYDIVNIAEEHSSCIIVITDEEIHSDLQRLGMSIELELPNQEELLTLIKNTVSSYGSQIKVEWDEENYKEVATILLGLSEIEVKNVLSSLIVRGYVNKDDLVELKYMKDNMFADISGLEKVNVDKKY